VYVVVPVSAALIAVYTVGDLRANLRAAMRKGA
jgi:hypothetical protein